MHFWSSIHRSMIWSMDRLIDRLTGWLMDWVTANHWFANTVVDVVGDWLRYGNVNQVSVVVASIDLSNWSTLFPSTKPEEWQRRALLVILDDIWGSFEWPGHRGQDEPSQMRRTSPGWLSCGQCRGTCCQWGHSISPLSRFAYFYINAAAANPSSVHQRRHRTAEDSADRIILGMQPHSITDVGRW